MMSTGTTTPIKAKIFTAPGAKATPGAADKTFSTETTMVSYKPQFLSIHNPTVATSPATSSTIPPEMTTAGTSSEPGNKGLRGPPS